MNSNVFGIDIAKLVFQIHWVDQETGEIHSDKVKRKVTVHREALDSIFAGLCSTEISIRNQAHRALHSLDRAIL